MQPQVIMLPVESIFIGKRQRSSDPATDKHVAELAGEIASNGLLHAIAVDKNHELVAGWCRLNAIKSLNKPYYYASAEIGAGFIPCVVVHQDDERERFRLELMENLRRKNLTPLDQAKAVAALHRMYQETHGPEWTETQTGRQLDALRGEERHALSGHREVAESMILDQFADDPEVARAPSRREAMKIASKKLEQAFTQGLGALATLQQRDFEVTQSDCTVVLPLILSEAYHGIIVDPPYGVDADTFGEQTMPGGHQYKDTEMNAFAIAHVIFKEGYRICKENAHLYMFCDIRFFDRLCTEAGLHGWNVFNTPLIWDKVTTGHAPWPGYFSRRYECILFACKGNRKLEKSRSDVFTYPAERDKLHAAQKPVELYTELMKLSFFPGETVLDPCAGAGTIFRAAKAAGIKAVGLELDEQYFNICKHVISEL